MSASKHCYRRSTYNNAIGQCIIESIQTELSYFRSTSFVHISREFNSVAHALAKEASCSLRDSVWLEEVPDFIAVAVLREQLCASILFWGSIFSLLMK
jgi:hypothetical protein